MIRVQEQAFDLAKEYQALVADDSTSGAVVLFVGRVRDLNQGYKVHDLSFRFNHMSIFSEMGILKNRIRMP